MGTGEFNWNADIPSRRSTTDDREWYYDAGTRCGGPINVERLHVLVQTGELSPKTRIWKSRSEGDWERYSSLFGDGKVQASQKPANRENAGDANSRRAPASPPPLIPENVNDTLAWLLALSPLWLNLVLLSIPREMVYSDWFSTYFTIMAWAFVTVLAFIDAKYVERKTYLYFDGIYSIWFVPAYLYKRMQALGQKRYYFYTFIATSIVLVLLIIVARLLAKRAGL